ncbi:MAG: hypothetical protein AAF798_11250 [Bacteroidota bacterium]
MLSNRLFVGICCLLFGLASCVQPPDYPDEPVISFVSIGPSVISQAQSQLDTSVTVDITVSFTDGDGDLGFGPDEGTIDVTVTDSRLELPEVFTLPFIPEQGTGNGISGEITVRVFDTCCRAMPGFPGCFPNPGVTDTASFTIQIMDRAGNMSNLARTDVITIICD